MFGVWAFGNYIGGLDYRNGDTAAQVVSVTFGYYDYATPPGRPAEFVDIILPDSDSTSSTEQGGMGSDISVSEAVPTSGAVGVSDSGSGNASEMPISRSGLSPDDAFDAGPSAGTMEVSDIVSNANIPVARLGQLIAVFILSYMLA